MSDSSSNQVDVEPLLADHLCYGESPRAATARHQEGGGGAAGAVPEGGGGDGQDQAAAGAAGGTGTPPGVDGIPGKLAKVDNHLGCLF